MTDSGDLEPRLVRFLLGTLPEAVHEGIEERLFTDDRLQEELKAAIDDLIHAYLAGALAPAERTAFETHFLASPRHWERLVFVRELVEATRRVGSGAPVSAAPAAPSRPGWRVPWPLAAATVIATAAGLAGLFMRDDTDPVGQISQGPSPSPAVAPSPPTPSPSGAEALPSPAASPRSPDASGPVRLVRLRAGPSDQAAQVLLTGTTRTVRLEVEVAAGSPSYDVVVRDAGGREAWRVEGVAPSAPDRPLVLPIPANVFGPGDYVVTVEEEALRGESPAPALERRLRVVLRRP